MTTADHHTWASATAKPQKKPFQQQPSKDCKMIHGRTYNHYSQTLSLLLHSSPPHSPIVNPQTPCVLLPRYTVTCTYLRSLPNFFPIVTHSRLCLHCTSSAVQSPLSRAPSPRSVLIVAVRTPIVPPPFTQVASENTTIGTLSRIYQRLRQEYTRI